MLMLVLSVAGFAGAFFDTKNFIADQYPSTSPLAVLPPSQNAKILAYQVGNLYGLMALLGFSILNITDDPKVVRAYITCLAIGDIGHVAPLLWVWGWERAVAFREYNTMAWGNIGATLFLFIIRVAYLAGLFGKDNIPPKGKRDKEA
jgi:hypothetical protein